jgi:hypothetical protein
MLLLQGRHQPKAGNSGKLPSLQLHHLELVCSLIEAGLVRVEKAELECLQLHQLACISWKLTCSWLNSLGLKKMDGV